jgi:hypothetical protein
MSPSRRRLLSFAVRLSAAAAIGALTWWTCGGSWQSLREVRSFLCHVTDWPVAVVGRALFPHGHQAIDVFYHRSLCDFCTNDQVLWRHLRLAVPVYLILSYLVTGIWFLIARGSEDRD